MHELSLAQSLLGLVRRHVPPAATVRRVHVRAGPFQAIDPDAMRWAWLAATTGAFCDGASLELTILPWTMTCPVCGRRWQSDDPLESCACGHADPDREGDDALILTAIDLIDDLAGDEEATAGRDTTPAPEGVR